MTLVPFTGTLPEVEAVYGRHVDTAFVDYPPAQGLLRAGKLPALATGSRTRPDWLPGVPTVANSVIRFRDRPVVRRIRAGADAAVIRRANGQLACQGRYRCRSRALLHTQGIDATSTCGAPFAAELRKRFVEYGQVIRDAHIKTSRH